MAGDEASDQRVEPSFSGAGLRLALVLGRFNDRITFRLLEGAQRRLSELGVADVDVQTHWLPGAFELPFAAKQLALTGRVDAVIALGAVIRGETGHYDFVAGECARGIQQAQLDTGVPIVFGVLTTDTVDQALARSGPPGEDKGAEAVDTAVEMARFTQDLWRKSS